MPFQEQDTVRFRQRDFLKAAALAADGNSLSLHCAGGGTWQGRQGRGEQSQDRKGKRARRNAKPTAPREK
ncbi:MAG: hypothetical protein KAY65_05960 [Planctomycetes bacterium]|nr:hypothetical protein [Planctomycetota bacterium]